MPLDTAHVKKSALAIVDTGSAVEEKDAIQKDVRAPQIEMTFELQKDFHANSQDPAQSAIADELVSINFSKIGL